MGRVLNNIPMHTKLDRVYFFLYQTITVNQYPAWNTGLFAIAELNFHGNNYIVGFSKFVPFDLNVWRQLTIFVKKEIAVLPYLKPFPKHDVMKRIIANIVRFNPIFFPRPAFEHKQTSGSKFIAISQKLWSIGCEHRNTWICINQTDRRM